MQMHSQGENIKHCCSIRGLSILLRHNMPFPDKRTQPFWEKGLNLKGEGSGVVRLV